MGTFSIQRTTSCLLHTYNLRSKHRFFELKPCVAPSNKIRGSEHLFVKEKATDHSHIVARVAQDRIANISPSLSPNSYRLLFEANSSSQTSPITLSCRGDARVYCIRSISCQLNLVIIQLYLTVLC